MIWKRFPNEIPTSNGYYFTYYFNTEYNDFYYKAIWWNGSTWVSWKKFKADLSVHSYVDESRNDYYVPCMEYAERKYQKILIRKK